MEDSSLMHELLLEIYDRLLRTYGPQYWWPAETKLEVVVGAILTQSTAWSNVTKAITNLKDAELLNTETMGKIPERKLATLIRPTGYYNAKAKKLKAFIGHLEEKYGGRLEALLKEPMPRMRQELLSIYGIGDETADSIILYAAEKPIFVVDSYTRRLFSRMNLTDSRGKYGELQELFMENLPRKTQLFQEYHALIVRHCKGSCLTEPICDTCSLLGLCPYPERQSTKNSWGAVKQGFVG